jgi:starch synthase
MDLKKVLYISQEISPYVPASDIADKSRDLAQGIQEKGFEVRTFMPRYGLIKERRNQLHEVIRLSGLNIEIDNSDHPLIIKVATLLPTRMQVYFIDNEDYFLRSQTAPDLEIRLSPEDNDERSMFFVRGVVETVKKLRWDPGYVHCIGWISAIAPMYLRRIYADDPTFNGSKIIYSLFNDKFEGTLDARMAEKLLLDGFTPDDIAAIKDKPVDWIALNKLAIDHADGIAQSSAEVDQELLDYIKESGKPFLPFYDGADRTDKLAEFYASLQQ